MKYYLALIMLSITSILHAQNTVKGNIKDESNIDLPAVTIKVLSLDSTMIKGGITDNNGYFQFEEIDTGKYILAISHIGYTNQYFNFEMHNTLLELPTIILKTDNILLNDVTITASSFIKKNDHLLIIPNKKQIKNSFSGYDVLYNLMIPGLTINRKTKTVNAVTGDASLYINGIKADSKEIQNLQPKDIERIEYYILPTKKPFTGDAASINYIIKTHKTGGYITLNGEQNIGYQKGDYNIGTKFCNNNTYYSFWGGHNMQSYDGIQISKDENMFLNSHTINRNTQDQEANYCNNQQFAQFKIANNTKKHNLSASASVIHDITPHNNQNKILNYSENNNEYNILSTDNSNSKSIRTSLNLEGTFNLNKQQQLTVKMNGGYTNNIYTRTYIEKNQQTYTNTNEDLYSLDGQIAYQYDPNESNSFYSRISHYHNITSSNYNGNYKSWQHLWTGESLFQFMYIHNFSKKTKFMISPVITWLNYKLHGYNLSSSWNKRLNMWIVHNINSKQMIGCGYNLGSTQPNISYLNSVSQDIDFYRVKRGNPYLNNTKMHAWYILYEGALHRLFNFQCVLWYTKDMNNIYTNYYLDENKLISSYASDDSYNTAKADISITNRISDNLRIKTDFNYTYMYVPHKPILKQHSYVATFDINYFIKSFAFNVYAKTPQKILNKTTLAFMKIPVSYGISIRYSGKNWMTEVGTENIFSKHIRYKEYADYSIYKYNQIQTSRIYQQTAYIKLSYTFDFGKRTDRETNSIDKNINSAILKVR